jgi:3-oxoacyl-[acyl-carrier protein] reductase
MELSGKKTIVTGGVRGLGRAVVEKLLHHGAQVAIFDVDERGLEAVQQQHSHVDCIVCDVSNYDHVVAATNHYHKCFGAADVLINNAGIIYSAPLFKFTGEGIERHNVREWHNVLAADLHSVFYMTLCVAEKMITTRTRGVIVNISSVAASGNAGQSAYSAAKAAVNALTATWAKELSPLGLRVCGVAPGFTETESTKQALSEAALRDIVKKIPVRRLGRAEEIAHGVLSIITNDFFNGKTLELDGGLIL